MASQSKKLYPSLDEYEEYDWEDDTYNTDYLEHVTYSNKTAWLENEDNVVRRNKSFRTSNIIQNDKKFEKKRHTAYKTENGEFSSDKIFGNTVITKMVIAVFAIILIYLIYIYVCSSKTENILERELLILKKKYPNQKPELWHNVLKIANATQPQVHVLILLHKESGKVAECFAKDLIDLINKIIKTNGLLIYKENSEVVDYGVELSHYLELIKKHNHLIVFQLNKMSGNTARMFHVLCDDTPFSIRPSFFIFTMEDGTEETDEVRRPLAKAGHILRSAWSNLLENELHPLISRVVRNVAEILPETFTC